MDPQISELLLEADGLVLVRDQIATILAVESAGQMALAAQVGADPMPWYLRVFTERTAPWESYLLEPSGGTSDMGPIVNVSWESTQFDLKHGNVVSAQRGGGLFHIDCYAYAVSADDGLSGHVPGDEQAKREVQRVLGLVRKILMAAHYTYLGLPGRVARRWVTAENALSAAVDDRSLQRVAAARLSLQVEYGEQAPQVTGPPLREVVTSFKRSDTGQLIAVRRNI
ncbi:MAG TPA: hypothetical protein VFQ61_06700 [Polyangiaceae bacterium]|nr:hypothetical protein [Polyangiaceae bacterium]